MSVSRFNLVTAPTTYPVSVEEAKLFVRQDEEFDDAVISGMIQAACEYVETYTGRSLISKQWDLFLDTFPTQNSVRNTYDNFDKYFDVFSSLVSITLPKFPLLTLDEFEYQDKDDATQTFDQSTITIDAQNNLPAKLTLNPDESWPETSQKANSVRIRFSVGATKVCSVPPTLILAIKQLVAHWYENRESVIIGATASSVPLATEALLWSERVFDV